MRFISFALCVMKNYIVILSFAFMALNVSCQKPEEKMSEQAPVGNSYLHFIMYGQSLSVGAQSYPVLSTENIPGNYMLGDQIWINYWNVGKNTLNPLTGKLAKQDKNGSTNLYPFTRSGTITAECPLYGVVNHLQKKIGGNFIATSSGTSGRSIEELSKESKVSDRQHYVTEFKSTLSNGVLAARKNNCSISCPVIFFMQGENNYENKGNGLTVGAKSTSDKNEYKQLLVRLKDNMQDDILSAYGQPEKPVFITYQAGCQYGKNKELSIGMAQLEASNEYDDIICAGPVYPLPDRGGHLDPNGYRWYGEMLAKVYYKTQVLGEDFKPLQPKRLQRMENAKQIKIQFHVPVSPLVLDTWTTSVKFKDYGFEVHKDGIKQTLSNVAIEDDCVVITAANDLSSGRLEIIYAGIGENGVLNRGHGNLRDSDDYEAFFTYVDLDGKESGEYIYPRDPGNSLRPVNEVKNQLGQPIYGQPYPLYNWSVAFYYVLEDGQKTYVVPGFGNDTVVEQEEQVDIFSFYHQGNELMLHIDNQSDVRLDIVDMLGRIVYSRLFKESSVNCSIQNFSPGVYVATATVKGKSKQLRILKI